jgi:gliding motility-associated-like protein
MAPIKIITFEFGLLNSYPSMKKCCTGLKEVFFFILVSVLFLPLPVNATHQRAAEILYKHIDGLTYEITLISYTFTPSPANDFRDFLQINWGDGTSDDIPRVERTNLANDITYNRYIGQHTFPGPSFYTISCEDPNRNGGILNIPNSINIPLYIYSELYINPFLGGYNDSPELLIPPIDNGCIDQPYYHNPGAFDPNGDSLSYRLVPCLGAQGLPIPGYTLPAAEHVFRIDSVTGDVFWDYPIQAGEYNIAILIEEWRNGIKIGSVLRDMQIIIVACNNRPPVIETPADTCIEAGDTLVFNVRAYDPDSNTVTLTGTGGPLVITNSPASMHPTPSIGLGHTTATFTWPTICGHVLKQPYRVFFRAIDNGSPVNLVDITSMRILVIGPAPKNLTATPLGTSITLNWDNYACTNASGYYIYRKSDSTGYQPGYCQTGVPSYLGYSKIAQVADLTQTTFVDNNNGSGLVLGIKYCYLIIAYYPDRAESYASNEACASLKKDVPVITNVSVNNTSTVLGSMHVAWSKPTELDTIQAPGPYMYILERSSITSLNLFVKVDSLFSLNDTIYTDSLLNTDQIPYKYRVDLYNLTPGNRFLIGSSQVASSIFLAIFPSDKRLKFVWTNNVPWTNFRFDIYRQNAASSEFDSIGSSPLPAFIDTGLKNHTEYCYLVRSVGKYSSDGFVFPIINYSQIRCETPVDNIPPCPPVLKVTPECDVSTNKLSWVNPYDTCSLDIVKYYIYFTPSSGTNLILLDSLLNRNDTVYYHKPENGIAGCYSVIAIDSAGNKSNFSDTVCIDIYDCPSFRYRLPYIFTPNGDGFNDTFIPFPYTSVEKINLKIFDRWGKEVFETSDPDVNWDGNDKNTNRPCSDGVYFFVCDVYEITLTGTVKRTLEGSVTILR